MSFSYSGGVITQTGTDTDLSGLAGLTGVTVISYSSRYDIYNIGTNRLDIEGHLTINPENNMLISDAPTSTIPNMAVNVRANATLTLGVKTTVGTAVKYTTGTAFILTEEGSLNVDGSLHVEDDGTLEAFGATIQMAGPTRLRSGAYFTCEDLTLVNCRDASCQFRIEANNATDTARVSVTENGMTLNGDTNNDSCRLTTVGKVAFPSDAFVFNFIRAQYQPAASGYPSQVFLNFDNGNNVDGADFAYAGTGGTGIQFDGNLVDFRNVARRLRYTNANIKSGFCKTTKNVNFSLQDASGTGLSTVSYYAIDVDNGNRINSFNGFDSTADIVYSGQNAGPTLAITATVEFMAGENTTRFIDSRTNADDTILFRFISYTTNISSTSPVLIGLGDLNSVVVNATDALISEYNRTTVDAYTELETSAKFYDRAKSYLTANYAGEAATIVTRSGNAIDAGAFDIVIDATAASVFAFDGTTITIKASAYTGDINTTGTFTLLNGALLNGVLNGVLNVNNNDVLTEDIDGTFVVDTDTVTSFTIDGFIPTSIETTGSGSTTIIGVNNAKLTTTTITGTGTLVLGDGLNPSANWVYSSGTNTLTLTGTEGDLLGLRGLAVVDYADAGGKTVFTVNDQTKIIINGTGDLTIDSDVEQMVCGIATPAINQNTFVVQNGGRLQVGKAKVVGGFTIFSSGPAIVFSNDSSIANFTVAAGYENLRLESGSRIDWYGGEIQSVGLLLPQPGSEFRTYSNEAVFVSVPSALQTQRQEAYIRMQTNDQIINGFVNKFGILLMIGKPTTFTGYEPISSGGAIDMSNQSTSSSYYDFEDLIAGKGNTRDIGGKHDTWIRLLNTNLGSSITVTSQQSNPPATSDQKYLVENRKSLLLNYEDENGTTIQGAKVYLRDTNHGSRLAANQVGTNASYQNDYIYTGTSDASGLIDFTSVTDSILLSVHHHSNPNGNVIYDIFDSRGNQNNTTDLFTFKSISYLQSVAAVTLELKGIGTLNHEQVLVTDFSIAQTNKTTVDAYTTLETPQKLYDRAKSYLYDNYAGEAATIVTRSGNEIDAGAFDIVIDATAASAFALSGNTITIKASEFVGDITTTGTITLSNGATFIGNFTDSSGTTTITTLTLTGLQPNSEVRVYDAGTITELTGVENSGTTFSTTLQASSVDIVIHALGYEYQKIEGADTSSNLTLPIQQRFDRNYRNP